jgi:hypothetical protein
MRKNVFTVRRLDEGATPKGSPARAVGQTSSISTQGAHNARSELVSTAEPSFIVDHVQNFRVSGSKRFKAMAGFTTGTCWFN